MFSQTAEYAMRAVVYLAEFDGKLHVTQDIAAATKVPAGYLAKVLQALSRAGLVSGSRGLHGGFRLARDPGKITLFDVLNAVEPLPRIERCPLGLVGHGAHLCPLHRRIDDAMAIVEKAYRETTVKEVVSSTGRKPLCPFPIETDGA
ncbi:MAG: Rrf2 family transcriptional regulator [Planctomycetota bacterium]|nr:Rrf2 family transcriptional regulator [Planctomycetota bacterium]